MLPADSSPLTNHTQSLVCRQPTLQPRRLDASTNRFTRRYAFRGVYHSIDFRNNDRDSAREESDQEDEESSESGSYGENDTRMRDISESRAALSSHTGPSTRYADMTPDRPPRIVLLDLPIEIVEHVAASLRDLPPLLDAGALYISERFSDFSTARFSLSAFSQVSSPVRRTVERVLYRHVQLDFTGWKGRKHPKWPAGSLRLLLRTLQHRPELGRYIYGAALDYQLSTDSEALEAGLKQFLGLTPNLTTLFLGQCPLALWDFPLLKTLTLATTFAPGILPSILEQFPKLRNLHLRDCHIMGFSPDLPEHKLQTLRFDSSHENAVAHFARVLSVCSDTVHHMDIRFIGGLLLPSPSFASRFETLPSLGGSNLRSLRLDNLSIFSNPASGFAQLLQGLTALRELHVSHHTSFAPTAFSILPPSLLTLTASKYYGVWEYIPPDSDKNAFMLAMANCLGMQAGKVSAVVASEGKAQGAFCDVQPVAAACEAEGIGFSTVDQEKSFIRINFCVASG